MAATSTAAICDDRDDMFRERRRSIACAALMLLAIAVVYIPPSLLDGKHALFGLDFVQLHQHRLEFARAAIAHGHFPAWYPRELDGTPFWSNLHSSPLVPTRLLLYACDPALGLTAGALVAAWLAALFTFAFARRLALSPVAAAAAGWTFACAGFFAARVLAGHLPLLEAYPSLPLLLWLHLGPATRKNLAAIALATACVVLCGHPQLPLYACVAAAIFTVVMNGRRALPSLAAMLFGAGATLFAWWPMLALIRRSARLLPLAPAPNDVALPLARLPSLLLPWRDGWPALVDKHPLEAFHGFPSVAWFWDTVGYAGIAPLVGFVLVSAWLMRGTLPRRRAVAFVILAGAVAPVAALPWHSSGGATILRSSARLLYVTTFSFAIAFAIVLDRILGDGTRIPADGTRILGDGTRIPADGARSDTNRARSDGSYSRSDGNRARSDGNRDRSDGNRDRRRQLLVALILVAHAIDLGGHARAFVHVTPRVVEDSPAALAILARELGDQRVAIDHTLRMPWNRRFDDVGFFDSLPLATSYAAILADAELPPTTNSEVLDGSALSAAALAKHGVRFVITAATRGDLVARTAVPFATMYEVPSPSPRAALFTAGDEAAPGSAFYARDSSGAITVETRAPTPTRLRILESWDAGWSATVDGKPASVDRGTGRDGSFMRVALPAGDHVVALAFHTPGATAGLLLSLASLILLALAIRYSSPT
jgi:hypothetical protein